MKQSGNVVRWAIGGALVVITSVWIVAAVGVAGGQGQGQAQAPPGGPMPPHRFGFGGPFGRGMGLNLPDLSDAQRDQIRSVIQNYADEMRQLTEQARTARVALGDAIMMTPLDETAIRQKSADWGAAETELAVARGRMQAEIFALLTPQQQQAFTERREQMKERMRSGPPGPPRRQGGRFGAPSAGHPSAAAALGPPAGQPADAPVRSSALTQVAVALVQFVVSALV